MNRLALQDIFRVAVAQRDNESNETECFIDLTDNQGLCSGELCGLNWKPMPLNSDRVEDTE